jgi:hypothetical protein
MPCPGSYENLEKLAQLRHNILYSAQYLNEKAFETMTMPPCLKQLMIAFLLLVSLQEAQGQSRRVLKGVVIDAHTERPMARVTVRSDRYSTKTDNTGRFELEIVRGEPLLVSATGFQTRRFNYERYRKIDSLTVFISRHTSSLGNIMEAKGSETVYQKDFENVLDYAFLGDTLAVLAYMDFKPRTPNSGETYLHNTLTFAKFGLEIKRLTLPDGVRGLYLDPLYGLWVVGDEFALKVKRSLDHISLEEVDPDYFRKFIAPASVASASSLFFSEVMPIVPQINYYVLQSGADSTMPVRYIRNERYFREAASDFRMLNPRQLEEARQLEDEYGIEAFYFAPYIRQNGAYFRARLPKSDYSEVDIHDLPESQAFGVGDHLLIIDVLNAWIYHHDMLGNPLDSVPMYHHRFDGERYRGMIQDRYNGKCYALHEKGGVVYLREVNPQHGGARNPFKIGNVFPAKVKVNNDWVYYTFRDTGSKEFRRLMREKLPD